MKIWPEQTKNEITVGGKAEVSEVKSLLCSIGFHGKKIKEPGEMQQINTVCKRCGKVLKIV